MVIFDCPDLPERDVDLAGHAAIAPAQRAAVPVSSRK